MANDEALSGIVVDLDAIVRHSKSLQLRQWADALLESSPDVTVLLISQERLNEMSALSGLPLNLLRSLLAEFEVET
jgi:TATA-binding protein-associated factor Taf7